MPDTKTANRRVITCAVCKSEQRAGYCAKARCYCGHVECTSYATTKGHQ